MCYWIPLWMLIVDWYSSVYLGKQYQPTLRQIKCTKNCRGIFSDIVKQRHSGIIPAWTFLQQALPINFRSAKFNWPIKQFNIFFLAGPERVLYFVCFCWCCCFLFFLLLLSPLGLLAFHTSSLFLYWLFFFLLAVLSSHGIQMLWLFFRF